MSYVRATYMLGEYAAHGGKSTDGSTQQKASR